MKLHKQCYDNESVTIGVLSHCTIKEYLGALLDEELYNLIKIMYDKNVEKLLKIPLYKGVFEKVTEYSNNIDTRLTIYNETVHYIEKEVTKRWVKYIEKRRIK